MCLLLGVIAAPAAAAQANAKTLFVGQELDAVPEIKALSTEPASFFWGDYDGDGFDDAFVIAPSGQAQLLRNLADGTLEEVTVMAGLSGIIAPKFAGWADMDLDGDLDLFVGTASGSSLFQNEGQGTFTEIAALAGLNHSGSNEHGGWIDYDKDGLPDLHVRTQFESVLYRNLGEATFERVELGLAPIAPIALGGVTPVVPPAAAPVATTSKSTSADETVGTISPAQPAPGSVVTGKAGIAIRTSTTQNTFSPTGGTAGTTEVPDAAGASPLMAVIPCANTLKDQSGPGCLKASSTPQLGKLYPISANLFVASGTGFVGIGTTTPTARLDVAGTARMTDTLTLAPSGDQALNIDTGSIYKGGALFMHTKGGVNNTALGEEALNSVTTAIYNVAIGSFALYFNTTGNYNTATGGGALVRNTTGYNNTASGALALAFNTIGKDNTAHGAHALRNNTSDGNTAIGSLALKENKTGVRNTATGFRALNANTTGIFNVASGAYALNVNTTGGGNVASGYAALRANTTGNLNTASGWNALRNNATGYTNLASGAWALYSNTSGRWNTASGARALYNNTTGYSNTANGYGALGFANTTGSRNIGLGFYAGSCTNGSYNIDIGNYGVAGESSTTRIGNYQTRAFMAGIRSVTTGYADAVTVMIDSAGQLGTISSSRRFKEDIRDMGDATERLLDLRAVLFRYKERNKDGDGPIEYGLIAEEVAEVFPELVVYDAEGKPETVKYHLLGTMLLNELQKEHERNEERARSSEERTLSMESQIAALQERLAAVEQRE